MNYSAKDSVLAVQVRGRVVADKERTAIGVRARVRHRKNACVRVGHPDLLVCELGPVYALRLSAVVVNDNFSALHHETWDNALENAIAVMEIPAQLSGAQGSEVFHSPRNLFPKELHHDSTFGVPVLTLCADLDDHVDLDVTEVELGHLVVDTGLFIAVETGHEDFGGCLSLLVVLTLASRVNILLAGFPVLTKCLVVGFQLDGLSAVCERL